MDFGKALINKLVRSLAVIRSIRSYCNCVGSKSSLLVIVSTRSICYWLLSVTISPSTSKNQEAIKRIAGYYSWGYLFLLVPLNVRLFKYQLLVNKSNVCKPQQVGQGVKILQKNLDFIWNTVQEGLKTEQLPCQIELKHIFIDYDKVTYLSITIVTWGFEIRNKRNSGTIVTV